MTENTNTDEFDVVLDETNEDESVDYQALYEEQKAESDKWKNRYKSSQKKANEQKADSINPEEVQSIVDRSLSTIQFYSDNKSAIDLKDEIEGLVAKWLERNDAYLLLKAKTDPVSILDDATKSQLAWNTALTWASSVWNNYSTLSPDEIAKLPEEEFNKLFPSWGKVSRYYWDTGE